MSARDVVEALSGRPEPPAGLCHREWDALIRNYLDSILDMKAEIRDKQTKWRTGKGPLDDVDPETRSRTWRALNAVYESGVHGNVAGRLINAARVADNGPLIDPYEEYVRAVADDLAEYDTYLRQLPLTVPEDTPW